MSLTYLDVETTGLDSRIHEVWEAAYAVDDGPIHALNLRHDIRTADPAALVLTQYRTRSQPFHDPYGDIHLRSVLAGATIVGANPAFDTRFLAARWGVEPWHYRLLDIESYAMPILGHEKPVGLHTIWEDLYARGYDIPEPDHTAAGDVATLRACHQTLILLRDLMQWRTA